MAGIRDEITQAYRTMEEAFFNGNADALSMLYTEDAEWLVPGAPPVRGRQAIAEAWKGVIGSGGNRVRVEVREVQDCGESAYDIGAFTITGPDGAVLGAGKYIVIWQHQPDGSWKTHRDIFNWDVPPSGA